MILGVDFSLTSTGVCAITDGEAECITIQTKKEEEWWLFPNRVRGIGDGILEWATPGEDLGLVIETPAYLATGSAKDRMLAGWWLLVNQLREATGCVPLRVTPSQVKKYATGKGNTKKDEVLAAVIRRYPDVPVSGNDQADALTLAAIGAGVYDEPFETHTKYQQEVIETIRKGLLT